MNRMRARADAAEALSKCLPGQMAIVWYADDTVYHERIMVWRVSGTIWFILTPDGDLYQEDWSGHAADGPVSFRLKNVEFRYFSRVGQPVYRFQAYPSDAEFKRHVETALRELGELGERPSWDPQKVINAAGKEVEATLFLGTLMVPRRLTRRTGRLEAPDAAPAMKGLGTPPDGHLWVAAQDSQDFDLGKEIVDGEGKGVLLDDKTGALAGSSGWTLVRLLKVEDVPAFVETQVKDTKKKLEARGDLTAPVAAGSSSPQPGRQL